MSQSMCVYNTFNEVLILKIYLTKCHFNRKKHGIFVLTFSSVIMSEVELLSMCYWPFRFLTCSYNLPTLYCTFLLLCGSSLIVDNTIGLLDFFACISVPAYNSTEL